MTNTPSTRPSLLLAIRDPRNSAAWSEFVRIYEPLIHRLIRRQGIQDADARELTQEVLLAVSRSVGRWNVDATLGSFRGWLCRVTRNLMINFLTKQRREPHGVGDTDFQRLLENQPAPDSEDSAYFDLEHRRHLFHWAAEQIRPEFRAGTWAAFWQTCVEGRAIPDVAAELNLTVGAVYVARSRVMARLRAEIEQLTHVD